MTLTDAFHDGYELGYKHAESEAIFKKFTPNAIRKILGFSPIKDGYDARVLIVDETHKDDPVNKSDNPYWDRITAVANRQRSKGLKEYGKGVEDDTADINVRLDRIEEELIDALMYLEHLRDGVNKIKEVVG